MRNGLAVDKCIFEDWDLVKKKKKTSCLWSSKVCNAYLTFLPTKWKRRSDGIFVLFKALLLPYYDGNVSVLNDTTFVNPRNPERIYGISFVMMFPSQNWSNNLRDFSIDCIYQLPQLLLLSMVLMTENILQGNLPIKFSLVHASSKKQKCVEGKITCILGVVDWEKEGCYVLNSAYNSRSWGVQLKTVKLDWFSCWSRRTFK